MATRWFVGTVYQETDFLLKIEFIISKSQILVALGVTLQSVGMSVVAHAYLVSINMYQHIPSNKDGTSDIYIDIEDIVPHLLHQSGTYKWPICCIGIIFVGRNYKHIVLNNDCIVGVACTRGATATAGYLHDGMEQIWGDHDVIILEVRGCQVKGNRFELYEVRITGLH